MLTSMALQASRRNGVRFKIADAPRKHPASNVRRKLSDADILRMRRWAGRDGWGMSRKAQAEIIGASFPHVSAVTICDVLANATWFDPSYEPGSPDLEYWSALPTSIIVLRMLEAA